MGLHNGVVHVEDQVELGGLRSQILHNWERPFIRHTGYPLDTRKEYRKSVNKAFGAYSKELRAPSTVHYKITNDALDAIVPTLRRANRRIFVNNFWNAIPPHRSMFVEWDHQYLWRKLQDSGVSMPTPKKDHPQPDSEIHGVWIQERDDQFALTGSDNRTWRSKFIKLPLVYSYRWFGQIGAFFDPKQAPLLHTPHQKQMAERGEMFFSTRTPGLNIKTLAYHDDHHFWDLLLQGRELVNDRWGNSLPNKQIISRDRPTTAKKQALTDHLARMGAAYLLYFGLIDERRFSLAGMDWEKPFIEAFTKDEITMLRTLNMGVDSCAHPTAHQQIAGVDFFKKTDVEDSENGGARSMHAAGYFTIITSILSLINQPWTIIEEDGVTARGTRSVTENLNRGEIHKVITLNVPQDKAIRLFNKTKARTRKFGTAQHTVRGHWRTYRRSGETVWVGEHYRGDAKYGIVHKDYEVVKRKGLLSATIKK